MGIEQSAIEGRVDVFAALVRLRRQRALMVQTLPQYIFIYRALLEASRNLEGYIVRALPDKQPVGVSDLDKKALAAASSTKVNGTTTVAAALAASQDEGVDASSGGSASPSPSPSPSPIPT